MPVERHGRDAQSVRHALHGDGSQTLLVNQVQADGQHGSSVYLGWSSHIGQFAQPPDQAVPAPCGPRERTSSTDVMASRNS
jgi:hypothetical protein